MIKFKIIELHKQSSFSIPQLLYHIFKMQKPSKERQVTNALLYSKMTLLLRYPIQYLYQYMIYAA